MQFQDAAPALKLPAGTSRVVRISEGHPVGVRTVAVGSSCCAVKYPSSSIMDGLRDTSGELVWGRGAPPDKGMQKRFNYSKMTHEPVKCAVAHGIMVIRWQGLASCPSFFSCGLESI